MIPDLMQRLDELFAWCLRTSLEASAIVVVILALQGLLGRRLPARWRYGLWLILLVRLVIPWMPASPVSVFNALPEVALPSAERHLDAPSLPAPAPVALDEAPGASALPGFSLAKGLLLAWLAGVVAFLTLVSVSSLRLWRRVWRAPTLEHPQLRELLAECKSMLGVSTPVDLVALKEVNTPALLGFLRPRLVLPADLPSRMSLEELRFIFLHEIAHLKRNDILVNWLTTFLQALHWFNPVIWYAFHRMRGDRELACDARALSCLSVEEHQPYGFTVLRLLEQTQRTRPLPGMAGVAEDKSGLKRRITMIAFFGESTRRWTLVAVLLLLAATPFVLTRAKAESQAKAPDERIVDKIDYPFVDDPAVLGRWESVDFVREKGKFVPGKQQFQGDLYLKALTFKPQGEMDEVWTWTKGLLLHPGDKTASKYDIQNIGGKDYLFFEWKSGDYTIRHMKPQYYVLERVEQETAAGEASIGEAAQVEPTSIITPDGRIEDKIDYPFVDDPAVLGSWDSVDFVNEKKEFDPAKQQFPGDLFLKSMTFKPQGEVEGAWSWTKGLLLHSGDKTASKYDIQVIGGREYLFFEWKSGDYTIRHMKPQYYVLERAPSDAEAQPPETPVMSSSAAPTPQAGPVMPEVWIDVPFALDASGRRRDKMDWPFVDDPYVVGHWTSVDFVKTREQFQPGRKQWGSDLFLKELEFRPGGQSAKPWWTWTRGLVMHSGDQTAAHYFLRNIEGQDYLFYEWKSGDYCIRGMQPAYYVLRRDGASVLPAAEPVR